MKYNGYAIETKGLNFSAYRRSVKDLWLFKRYVGKDFMIYPGEHYFEKYETDDLYQLFDFIDEVIKN